MIILATLPQATEQEVFDQVVTHLLTQGQKCQDFDDDMNPVCAYRNSDGQSCAAGCLIGFGEYREESFEGKSWQVLIDEEIVPENHKNLISRLQSIHDNTLAEYWYKSLKKVAETFNLSTITLDKAAKENNFIQ
jgi:hypothetical protein